MRIGFVIYDGMTALDFIGVYDPLTRLKTMGFVPDLTWEICGLSAEVRDSTGLLFTPSEIGLPLEDFDLVVIPGGFGTRVLVDNKKFIKWIETAQDSSVVATVCTGSLLIGAAGLLIDKQATTHPSAYEALRPYCGEVLEQRIVDEGHIITARGVCSAIDLGLYLCERYVGTEVKERIRIQMDYQTS
ncbi:MAG: DJ-1/PfpI family protein [Bacillota bacterium]|nr:DJ-1/PfpI family protein [Bacillota bacterium]